MSSQKHYLLFTIITIILLLLLLLLLLYSKIYLKPNILFYAKIASYFIWHYAGN